MSTYKNAWIDSLISTLVVWIEKDNRISYDLALRLFLKLKIKSNDCPQAANHCTLF